MIEFGKTLREAREAKGLTVSELADKTRLMHQVIEGLESENFSRIAAPIYGRGFVKLICEVLELDAKPLCEAFTELYQQHRDNPPPAKNAENETRGIQNETRGEVAPAPIIAPSQPSFFDQQPATSNPQPATSDPQPATSDPQPTSPFHMAGTDPAAAPDPDIPTATSHRYRLPGSDFNSQLASAFTLSRMKRLAILAIAALLIILGLILGIRSLYIMTMPNKDIQATPTADLTTPTKKLEKPTRPHAPAPRERVPVNPLYID